MSEQKMGKLGGGWQFRKKAKRWAFRIPAAIAKAEGLLERDKQPFPECPNHMRGNHPHSDACIGFFRTRRVVKEFTATEVALAKALFRAHHEAVFKILQVGWDKHEEFESEDGDEPCTHCVPLRAFTEKVESL